MVLGIIMLRCQNFTDSHLLLNFLCFFTQWRNIGALRQFNFHSRVDVTRDAIDLSDLFLTDVQFDSNTKNSIILVGSVLNIILWLF